MLVGIVCGLVLGEGWWVELAAWDASRDGICWPTECCSRFIVHILAVCPVPMCCVLSNLHISRSPPKQPAPCPYARIVNERIGIPRGPSTVMMRVLM